MESDLIQSKTNVYETFTNSPKSVDLFFCLTSGLCLKFLHLCRSYQDAKLIAEAPDLLGPRDTAVSGNDLVLAVLTTYRTVKKVLETLNMYDL